MTITEPSLTYRGVGLYQGSPCSNCSSSIERGVCVAGDRGSRHSSRHRAAAALHNRHP